MKIQIETIPLAGTEELPVQPKINDLNTVVAASALHSLPARKVLELLESMYELSNAADLPVYLADLQTFGLIEVLRGHDKMRLDEEKAAFRMWSGKVDLNAQRLATLDQQIEVTRAERGLHLIKVLFEGTKAKRLKTLLTERETLIEEERKINSACEELADAAKKRDTFTLVGDELVRLSLNGIKLLERLSVREASFGEKTFAQVEQEINSKLAAIDQQLCIFLVSYGNLNKDEHKTRAGSVYLAVETLGFAREQIWRSEIAFKYMSALRAKGLSSPIAYRVAANLLRSGLDYTAALVEWGILTEILNDERIGNKSERELLASLLVLVPDETPIGKLNFLHRTCWTLVGQALEHITADKRLLLALLARYEAMQVGTLRKFRDIDAEVREFAGDDIEVSKAAAVLVDANPEAIKKWKVLLSGAFDHLYPWLTCAQEPVFAAMLARLAGEVGENLGWLDYLRTNLLAVKIPEAEAKLGSMAILLECQQVNSKRSMHSRRGFGAELFELK